MSLDRDKGSAESAVYHAIWNGQEDQSPLVKRLLEHNQILKHNYAHNAVLTQTCALEGCDCQFELTLIPRQLLYPKYCEKHRNRFQREFFLKRQTVVA